MKRSAFNSHHPRRWLASRPTLRYVSLNESTRTRSTGRARQESRPVSAGRLSVFGARGKRLYAASHRLSTGFESPPDPLKDQARATCALALIAASSVDHDLIIIVRSSLAARHLAQLHADLSNQSQTASTTTR